MPNLSAFDLFCQHASRFTFPPETPLLQQDQAINEVFWLETGLVKLTRSESNGREMITGLRFPGKLLGAASAIAKIPSPMTVTTLTQCEIHRLSAHKFIDLIETDADFAHHVLELISQQQQEQMIRQAQLGLLSARARLALLLLDFSREIPPNKNGEIRLQLPLKDTDVAAMLAIDPAHLSRIFSKLAKDGLIRKSGGWIYLIAPELLEQEANGGFIEGGGGQKISNYSRV
jgi:CRP-like cAMP-binding protein